MSVWLSPDPKTAHLFHLSLRFPDGSILPCSFSMTKEECTTFLEEIDKEMNRYAESVAKGNANASAACPTLNMSCMSWCRGQMSLDLCQGCCCKMSRLGTKLCLKKLSNMCHDWHDTGKLKEKY